MVPALIAVATLAAVATTARRLGWGWTAPMIVYAAVWTVAVIINAAKFFPFYDLAGSTWAAIGAAGVAFVGAGFAARFLPAITHGRACDDSRLVTVTRVYFCLGLLGAALFFFQVHRVLGIEAILTRPIDVHTALANRTIGSAHLFLYYFGVAGTILLGYQMFCRTARPRTVDLLLLAGFILAMAVSTERNHMLWALACWLFMLMAPPVGDSTLVRMAGVGTAIAVLAVTFYIGAGQWLGKSAANIANALVIEGGRADPAFTPEVRSRLATPGYVPDLEVDVPASSRLRLILPGGPLHPFAVLYMSVAAALPSLDQGIRLHERSYGQLTFRPFVRGLSRLGLIPDTLRLTSYDDVRTPYPANAYTYLYEHVRDFGLPGAIVIPGLFGLLAGWLYLQAAAMSGSQWTVWLAMLQGMILWSPFQNRFVLTVSAYLVAALGMAFVFSRSSRSYNASMSATSRSAE